MRRFTKDEIRLIIDASFYSGIRRGLLMAVDSLEAVERDFREGRLDGESPALLTSISLRGIRAAAEAADLLSREAKAEMEKLDYDPIEIYKTNQEVENV